MALPEFTRQQVEKKLSVFGQKHIPPHARSQIRLAFRFRGNSVTLLEQRLSYLEPVAWIDIPTAQFRFSPGTNLWHLYWADRNS